MAHGHGHSIDEYLETIYFLAFPIGEYRPATASNAIASRVAEMLGVSRASAGEMLKRLEAEGLVERGEQKEAILTPTGIERAEHVVRKHRLIERFLTDFMGYTAAESHVHADELGDTFTDDMIERINERLGYPDRCPHGWPVETDVEQAENARARLRSPTSPRATRPRSCGSPSTTAISCTGSTTRACARASRCSARDAALRRRASSPSRSTATSRRSTRRRPQGLYVRPAAVGYDGGERAEPAAARERSALSVRSHVKSCVVAAEVAVRGRLRVDRAAQVEVADDRRRAAGRSARG